MSATGSSETPNVATRRSGRWGRALTGLTAAAGGLATLFALGAEALAPRAGAAAGAAAGVGVAWLVIASSLGASAAAERLQPALGVRAYCGLTPIRLAAAMAVAFVLVWGVALPPAPLLVGLAVAYAVLLAGATTAAAWPFAARRMAGGES